MKLYLSDSQIWIDSSLLHEVPLNIAVIDRDLNVVYANNPFAEQFGSWKNMKCFEVYRRADEACPGCEMLKTFTDGKPRHFEEEIGDHEYYTINILPATDTKNEITHVIALSENITAQRRQQLESEIIFQSVPSYIAVIDRKFKIIRANDNLLNTFGDGFNRRCYEVYKKRDSACENCPAALSFLDGQEHSSTHVGVSSDGEERHYVVTTSPLTSGDPNSRYVVEILTDITHIKKLEKEKLDSERLAAVGQTVAGLSHSIKNIIMGVEGGMYMLSSGIERDDKKRLSDGWKMLQRNIGKVSSLVKDFLSFAKGRSPELLPVDPNSLLDEIVELYVETSRQLGVSLLREEKSTIQPVPLDADAMHTCLTNLVSNAIDACQISKNDGCTVKVGVQVENDELVFKVTDNGCGMEYDIKQKVFTTFFTTKGGRGTGIGLLTTNKIVQEHGGNILVESEPGRGSVFKIILPLENLRKIQNSTKNGGL